MKKVIVSILLISYLAVSSGVMVNFHYCMNRLDSTRLFAGKMDKCGRCGMHTDGSKGCCRDEVQLIKMSDDQKSVTGFVFDLPLLSAGAHVPSAFIDCSFYNAPVTDIYAIHSPPILSGQDIYLKNRVFRV